jgi:hypothetical protein
LNDDSDVDGFDLALFAADFGQTNCSKCPIASIPDTFGIYSE